MASQWFYARNGQRHGPVNSAQLTALAKSGQLSPADLIWKEGMTQWVPAGNSPQLFPKQEQSATQPTSTGQRHAVVQPPIILRHAPTSRPQRRFRGLAAGLKVLAISGVLVGTGYYLLQQKVPSDSKPLNPNPPLITHAADSRSPQTEERTEGAERTEEARPPVEEVPKPEVAPALPSTAAVTSTAEQSIQEQKKLAPWDPSDLAALAAVLEVSPGHLHPLTSMVEQEFKGRTQFHKCVAGPYVISLTWIPGGTKRTRLWHRLTGVEVRATTPKPKDVYAPITFAADGTKFMSLDGDLLRAWAIKDEASFSLEATQKQERPHPQSTYYPVWTKEFLWLRTAVLIDHPDAVTLWQYDDQGFSKDVPCKSPLLPPNTYVQDIATNGTHMATVVRPFERGSTPWTNMLLIAEAADGKAQTSIPVGDPLCTLPPIESYSHPPDITAENRYERYQPVSLLFTPDGERLLASVKSRDQRSAGATDVGIVDLESGKIRGVISLRAGNTVACVDQEYKRAAVLEREEVRTATGSEVSDMVAIYNLVDGSRETQIPLPEPMNGVHLSEIKLAFNQSRDELVAIAGSAKPDRRDDYGRSVPNAPVAITVNKWRIKDGVSTLSLTLSPEALTGQIGVADAEDKTTNPAASDKHKRIREERDRIFEQMAQARSLPQQQAEAVRQELQKRLSELIKAEQANEPEMLAEMRRDRHRQEVRVKAQGGIESEGWLGPGDVHLIDGDLGVFWEGTSRRLLDIPALEQLLAAVDNGDRAWDAMKYEEALQHYSTVLVSPLRTVCGERLNELASRGVDALAALQDPAKAKRLAEWCNQRGVNLLFETDQGKALKSIWQEEERKRLAAEEAKRKKEEEERQRIAAKQAEEERVRQEKEQIRRAELQQKYEADLARKRKANQARAVRSRSLSAKQFIDKLQEEMDRGHLSASLIFENYVFQDVFGDPDTDDSFDVVWRRYGYRCKDGIVMLTVLVQGGQVVAKQIARY